MMFQPFRAEEFGTDWGFVLPDVSGPSCVPRGRRVDGFQEVGCVQSCNVRFGITLSVLLSLNMARPAEAAPCPDEIFSDCFSIRPPKSMRTRCVMADHLLSI